MRERPRLGAGRVVIAGLLALSAGRAPATEHKGPGATAADVCAFRSAAMQNLWDADSQVGLAEASLSGADVATARAEMAAAVRALRREAARAQRHGRRVLSAHEARRYRRELQELHDRAAAAGDRIRSRRHRGSDDGKAEAEVHRVATRLRGAIADLEAAIRTTRCLPTSLTLTRLFVGDGEERRLPGGIVVTAQEGIELRGRLVVDPPVGDLTLIASTGDVLLEGSITYRDPAAPTAVTSAARPATEPPPIPRAQPPPATSGGSIAITAIVGDVTVGASYFAIAGNGADATDLVVGSYDSPPPLLGQEGGIGGSITLAAPAGTVRILARRPSDPPPFQLGDGGHGQNVTLAAGSFQTTGPALTAIAGRGGNSGRLSFQGKLVQNQTGGVQLITGAGGGDGGSIVWDNSPGTTLLALTEVGLGGGYGGDGATRGGHGGDATYLSGRVTNHVAAPVALVTVVGGVGGSVLGPGAAVGLVANARGGDGGRATVLGNRGWDADGQTVRDGAPGGGVNAQGGDGGDVASPPDGLADDLPDARGGDGGAVEATSGDGGNGAPDCTGTMPGGRGGDAGVIPYLLAGAGGDAPGGPMTQGGDGAQATARLGAPGEGGAGNPAGACGVQAREPLVNSADGGKGTETGRLGAIDVAAAPACAGMPVPCSVTSTTAVTTVPTTPTTEPPCASQDYSGYFERDYSAPSSNVLTDTTTVQGSCTQSFDGVCTTWHVTTHEVTTYRLGDPTTHDAEFDTQGPGPYVTDALNFTYGCLEDGTVLWPDGTGYTVKVTDDETDTFSCGNCSCVAGFGDPPQHQRGSAVCCLDPRAPCNVPPDMCPAPGSRSFCELRQGICASWLLSPRGPANCPG